MSQDNEGIVDLLEELEAHPAYQLFQSQLVSRMERDRRLLEGEDLESRVRQLQGKVQGWREALKIVDDLKRTYQSTKHGDVP